MFSYRSRVGRAPALAWRAWGCGRHSPCPHSPSRLITEGAAPNPMGGWGVVAGWGQMSASSVRTAYARTAKGLCPARRKTPLPSLSFQAASS